MADRRSFLRNGFFAGLGIVGAGHIAAIAGSANETRKPERALRIAHITDCHSKPKAAAEKALKSVFRQINGMLDKPQLIINTGDSVLDANYTSAGYVEECWNVWNDSVLCCGIPIQHAIGNHDVWIMPDIQEQLRNRAGKRWCMQMLGLSSTFYSFEKGGWKFIALDSIGETGYRLDDVQFSWLEQELAASDKPVCIYSHVPIVSAAAMMYSLERRPRSARKWQKEMHADAKKLKDLFYRYPNVKLCLSGHVHYIDEVEYLGVKYMCNGSVSGNWWKGKLDEFPPAYAIIDLFTDGSVKKELVYYS
ncbi:MAG TPA: metallophosphoesterase [Chitinophagaceae bacterium]